MIPWRRSFFSARSRTRAQRVIAEINATADKLRHELLAGIPQADLQTCMRVLARVRERAEKNDRRQGITRQSVARGLARHNGQIKQRRSILRKRHSRSAGGGPK